MKFKNFIQFDTMDCGPTCLKMIAQHYKKIITLETLRKRTRISRLGVSLHSLSEAAEDIGFSSTGAIVTFEQLYSEVTLPAIGHWRQNHFVVIYKVTKNKIFISDPAQGNKTYSKKEFLKLWGSSNDEDEPMGIVLILEPTSRFYELGDEKDPHEKLGLKYLLNYFKRYKAEVFYVLFGIAISSVLQFVFPFLTQSIVDSGISNKDIDVIWVILLAQFALLLGRLFIDYIRSWFLLYINSRINVSILSEFLIKLMKLPVSYFDTKMSGDILQRMSDHRRVQDFLTGPALEIIFSLVTISVLGITLFVYSRLIFLVFIVSSTIYIAWTLILLKRRTRLDFKRFELNSDNQSETLQIINGIQEIKLNNSERKKRWVWEKIQSKLFKLNVDSLKYNQLQQSGSFLINEGKNLVITYIAAVGVIKGYFTLGVMLAIQAIVGQLNGPITLLINLIQSLHDTRLSLLRINEIHKLEEEEPNDKEFIHELPLVRNIQITDLSFTYPGSDSKALADISVNIPHGKTTAIVGSSGSGKTTLLKVLLKFYDGYEGEIKIDSADFRSLSPRYWRNKCGTVMQDGFIFSDTIANNIALSSQDLDWDRLFYSIKIANIGEFVESLPVGVNTKIGTRGIGLSQGQKQRILIARSVYKNPEFIFFDEATNALDANNESVIVRNLDKFFVNRTVVIVAHRLSTVKNADQIIVLEKGKVVEIGTHDELVRNKNSYYTLVKNQLELGA